MKDIPISFPGLFGDRTFNPHRMAIAFDATGERGIYWYGILICMGLLLAVIFCAKQAKKYGLTEDHVYDLILWELPLCVIGARLYYVLFYLELYLDPDGTFNWGRAIAIWDGGLAIYGAIIVAFLVLFLFCRIKKIPFGAFADLGVMGLLIGQSIGRWGNFMNREAYGSETSLPWRMGLMIGENRYIEVHPTFLYESLWNFVGLLLIFFVISKARTFDGENACFYFIWYGIGRTWIEGLRTDSLYLFDFSLFGQQIRVSQALSVLLVIGGFTLLLFMKRRHPSGQDTLFVNRSVHANSFPAERAAKATEAELHTEPQNEAHIASPSEPAVELNSTPIEDTPADQSEEN